MKIDDLDTKDRISIINITKEVEEEVRRSGVQEGLVNVYTRHTTTAIVINEDEEGLSKDFIAILQRLIPDDIFNYRHNMIDNNASAHIRSIFLSSEVTIPIKDGRLWLGHWQSIFFVELDGPRTRSFAITIIRSTA